jgi:cytochrome c oxidase subunit II
MDQDIYGWGLTPNYSTYGHHIDSIINILHVFMAVLFVGWLIYFIYCLVRFRQKSDSKASYESSKSKLPKYIEVGVLAFEIFLLVGLAIPAWSHIRAEFPPEEDATVMRVVAQQFAWNIHYPGVDKTFGRTDTKLIAPDNPVGLDWDDAAAKDDLVTVNQMHFPVDKPVIAYLSSMDVIHSFFIPVLRVKQDMIPGMVIPVWFQANKTGQFEIACAQLCGVGHSRMRGFVTIDTEEDYEAWFQEQLSEQEE